MKLKQVFFVGHTMGVPQLNLTELRIERPVKVVTLYSVATDILCLIHRTCTVALHSCSNATRSTMKLPFFFPPDISLQMATHGVIHSRTSNPEPHSQHQRTVHTIHTNHKQHLPYLIPTCKQQL